VFRFIAVFMLVALFLMLGLPILANLGKILAMFKISGLGDFIFSAAGAAIMLFVVTSLAAIVGVFIHVRRR
jgi:hypothetical protein